MIHSSIFKDICVTYHLAKSQKFPFSLVNHHSETPLHIIHSVVWEAPRDSNKFFHYYVVFVDDFPP